MRTEVITEVLTSSVVFLFLSLIVYHRLKSESGKRGALPQTFSPTDEGTGLEETKYLKRFQFITHKVFLSWPVMIFQFIHFL